MNMNKKLTEKSLAEKESVIDRMIRESNERFNNSRLKPISDNLGLKQDQFCISGDLGYMCIKIFNPKVEIRQYQNGRIFVFFDYDDNIGAWGGYSRKYEVKDTDFFKSPKWMETIKDGGVETSPDVIILY